MAVTVRMHLLLDFQQVRSSPSLFAIEIDCLIFPNFLNLL